MSVSSVDIDTIKAAGLTFAGTGVNADGQRSLILKGPDNDAFALPCDPTAPDRLALRVLTQGPPRVSNAIDVRFLRERDFSWQAMSAIRRRSDENMAWVRMRRALASRAP